jgi:methyl acetate hydrolase
MRIHRRAFLQSTGLALLTSSTFGSGALGQTGRRGPSQQALDAVLAGAVQRGDIPGVVAAVTDRDGTTYTGAFGERALGKGVAMTPDTVFNVASMTKAITGTAAMQLVEQGKLELDVPISRYVPDAAKLQVLEGFDEKGEPRLRLAKREVTLRQLMTHTSGFGYNQWEANLDRYMKAKNFPALNSGEEAAFYPPLLFDPGERWLYGISTDWVGKLVEVASGKPLGAAMQDNIFKPLGMGSTGYRLSPDMEARRAATHQRGADGKFTEVEWKGQPQPVREFGGGGLYSTAGDYLLFIRMILNGGKGSGNQILKPEMVELMSRKAMEDIRVNMLKTTNPSRSEDAEFFVGLPKSWGLTFMINEETAPTGRAAGSLAWAGLFNTFYWISPKAGSGGVYMSQSLPFVDGKTLASFYEFEKAVHQSTS